MRDRDRNWRLRCRRRNRIETHKKMNEFMGAANNNPACEQRSLIGNGEEERGAVALGTYSPPLSILPPSCKIPQSIQRPTDHDLPIYTCPESNPLCIIRKHENKFVSGADRQGEA